MSGTQEQVFLTDSASPREVDQQSVPRIVSYLSPILSRILYLQLEKVFSCVLGPQFFMLFPQQLKAFGFEGKREQIGLFHFPVTVVFVPHHGAHTTEIFLVSCLASSFSHELPKKVCGEKPENE